MLSVEEAKKAGKTQSEIDDWLSANLSKTSASTATMGGGDSKSASSVSMFVIHILNVGT